MCLYVVDSVYRCTKREWQGSGYETIRVSLDEDSWTRPLTRVEQRHIAFLQQETCLVEPLLADRT